MISNRRWIKWIRINPHLRKISNPLSHFLYFCGMMTRSIKLAISLLMFTTINAQQKWDLLKCVNYALENNISIKKQDIQALIARLTYKQSDLSKYPNVNFNSNLGVNTGRSIDRTTNQFTTNSIFYNSFNLQSN